MASHAPPRAAPARPRATVADRVRATLRDRPLAVSAGSAVVLAVVALGLYTPRYETNDDVTMNLIAAGVAFADRPDEHLLYTNVLVGLALSRLYGGAPAVPWYGLYQLAALTAAAAAIAYALLRVNPSSGQAVVVVLLLGVAVLPCFAEVQFTKTAFLASLAGLLLLLAPLRGAAPWPRAADAAGVALLVAGALVRVPSFLMAGVVVAPVALAAAYAAPGRAARRAAPVAAAVTAAVGLYLFDQGYYARDPAWADFNPYSQTRAQFTDYDRFDYTPASGPAFEAVGWAEVDLELLKNWCYADRERYSLAKLRQVVATAPQTPPPSLGTALRFTAEQFPRYGGLLRLLPAGVCVAVLTGHGTRRFALPAVLLGLTFVLMVVLAVYYWLPFRVAFSLCSGALAAAALRLGGEPPASRWSRFVRGGAAALAAGLVVWTVYDTAKADRHRARLHQGAVGLLRRMDPRPERLFVLWRDVFPLENLVTPLGELAPLRQLRCVSLSALQETPLTERRLHEYHISDLYRAVCERPDVALVASPTLKKHFDDYVARHYGIRPALAATLATRGEEPLVVYRRVPARVPPPGAGGR